MKRIVLSSHALDALREREILAEWIERTVRTPERKEPDRRHPGRWHALLRIPEFGGRWLRVVQIETVDEHYVITMFFDRKAGGQRT
ncbi:MAG TPA: DUF4258 domain-containing protein [Beijerinckiaceae bacterium]|jgi:hypothetical protein|nr:DUF4258 domain-containing protein [Beijerinckiaceae bacterium]